MAVHTAGLHMGPDDCTWDHMLEMVGAVHTAGLHMGPDGDPSAEEWGRGDRRDGTLQPCSRAASVT